jgi:hypothetical protein
MSRLANDNRFFFCWKLVALAINDKQLQSKIEMMQMMALKSPLLHLHFVPQCVAVKMCDASQRSRQGRGMFH